MIAERNSSRINWHQALAEVGLIGAGILIALAVDSWWEERVERQAEVEYLQSLQSDFEANRDELNKQFIEEERILNLGKKIHTHIESGFREISPADLNVLIGKFFWLYEWQPITGTYEEMLGSGRLLYLRNKSLRGKLSQYVHLVEEIKTTEREGYTSWYFEQSPFLREHLNMSRFGWVLDYEPTTKFGENFEALESREFHNLVTAWMVAHGDAVNLYREAVLAGDEILEIFTSELSTQ